MQSLNILYLQIADLII